MVTLRSDGDKTKIWVGHNNKHTYSMEKLLKCKDIFELNPKSSKLKLSFSENPIPMVQEVVLDEG